MATRNVTEVAFDDQGVVVEVRESGTGAWRIFIRQWLPEVESFKAGEAPTRQDAEGRAEAVIPHLLAAKSALETPTP